LHTQLRDLNATLQQQTAEAQGELSRRQALIDRFEADCNQKAEQIVTLQQQLMLTTQERDSVQEALSALSQARQALNTKLEQVEQQHSEEASRWQQTLREAAARVVSSMLQLRSVCRLASLSFSNWWSCDQMLCCVSKIR
jgi:chromosome segregation ATPase